MPDFRSISPAAPLCFYEPDEVAEQVQFSRILRTTHVVTLIMWSLDKQHHHLGTSESIFMVTEDILNQTLEMDLNVLTSFPDPNASLKTTDIQHFKGMLLLLCLFPSTTKSFDFLNTFLKILKWLKNLIFTLWHGTENLLLSNTSLNITLLQRTVTILFNTIPIPPFLF